MSGLDLSLEDHGSIALVRPLSEDGFRWLRDHVDPEALWFGRALVVEPRFVAPILEGAVEDGLIVE